MKRKRPTPQPETDPSREVLREIYKSTETKDLRRLERRPRHRARRIILLLLVFLLIGVAVALWGMTLFSPKKQFSGERVVVTVDGAERAVAGDPLTLTVTIDNEGDVKITQCTLTVRYPEDFQFVSASPKPSNEFSNGWEIGTLAAGKSTTITITGRLLGEVGSEKIFSASAGYQPANFASDFVSEGTLTTRITESTLDVTIRAPHATTSGQRVTYEVIATNTSDTAIDNVRLELGLPDGLSDAVADPKPKEGTWYWDQATLAPDASFTVVITGELSGDPGTVHELKVNIGVLDATSVFLSQREKSALVLILSPTLNITVTADGKSAGYPVGTRDTIPIRVAYSNDSDSDFSNATLTLLFTGKDSDGTAVGLVEESGVTSETPFTKASDVSGIRWTKDEIPDLARLVPGKSGIVNITLPLKSGLRTSGSGMNLTLGVQAKIAAESIGGTGAGYENMSEKMSFPINTELRLSSEGRFFSEEGETLGSGPLPPEVGMTTTYRVLWYVTNTMNGAKDVLISAVLPDGVSFVGAETSGGNSITYDETTRTVRWRIPKVDARVGQSLPTLTGVFSVSLTPQETDVGNTLPLLGGTTCTATDAFTATALTASSAAITTDLTNDTLAAGKGAVIPAGTVTNANTAVNTNGG